MTYEASEDWCRFLMWCLITLIEKDEINREITWMFLMFKLLSLFKELPNNGVMLVYVSGDGYFGNAKAGEEGKNTSVAFSTRSSLFTPEGASSSPAMSASMTRDSFPALLRFQRPVRINWSLTIKIAHVILFWGDPSISSGPYEQGGVAMSHKKISNEEAARRTRTNLKDVHWCVEWFP